MHDEMIKGQLKVGNELWFTDVKVRNNFPHESLRRSMKFLKVRGSDPSSDDVFFKYRSNGTISFLRLLIAQYIHKLFSTKN